MERAHEPRWESQFLTSVGVTAGALGRMGPALSAALKLTGVAEGAAVEILDGKGQHAQSRRQGTLRTSWATASRRTGAWLELPCERTGSSARAIPALTHGSTSPRPGASGSGRSYARRCATRGQ